MEDANSWMLFGSPYILMSSEQVITIALLYKCYRVQKQTQSQAKTSSPQNWWMLVNSIYLVWTDISNQWTRSHEVRFLKFFINTTLDCAIIVYNCNRVLSVLYLQIDVLLRTFSLAQWMLFKQSHWSIYISLKYSMDTTRAFWATPSCRQVTLDVHDETIDYS